LTSFNTQLAEIESRLVLTTLSQLVHKSDLCAKQPAYL